MNHVLLLFLGRMARRQGSTKIFCNFAKGFVHILKSKTNMAHFSFVPESKCIFMVLGIYNFDCMYFVSNSSLAQMTKPT